MMISDIYTPIINFSLISWAILALGIGSLAIHYVAIYWIEKTMEWIKGIFNSTN